MFRKTVLLSLAILGLASCGPQLGGRWEIHIEGIAVEDGVLDLQIGEDQIMMEIPEGQDAAMIRDLLTAELRGLGYSVDCFWSQPSRNISVEYGTPIPAGDVYYLVTWELPVSPMLKPLGERRIPARIGVGIRGPRAPCRREIEVIELVARRWMATVEENPELLLELTPARSAVDTELSAILESLREKGQPLTFGDIGEINGDCNHAVVHLVDGPVVMILLDTGNTQTGQVTGVRLED